MAEELKVLSPEVIEDTPFPNQDDTATSQSSQSTGDIVYPNTIKIPTVPTKKIANELISSSLNTQTRKILGEYSFTESGAIQIGKYKNGVSGDMRFTPDGITARNISGMTTFSVDGDTGSATFLGTLQANDFTIADEQGLISLNSFPSAGTTLDSANQVISGTSETDITGASLTFTVQRRGLYQFSYHSSHYLVQSAGNTANLTIRMKFNVNGGTYYPYSYLFNTGVPIDDSQMHTYSNSLYLIISPCTVGVKLTAQLESVTGSPTATILEWYLSYFGLGR